ncbi:GLPGLI family protein [Flavobacterium johnsoniae]|uniref:GLPGLI family protein n=1 Tax=Flavobacterium johnsoniae TaxID=986 RepID=UPI0025AFA8D7|nr:GLPGLI family protein [Flavobacterium johnsoniae]WJS96295.1 GLPGLI family protein [Flavobacterium johnsoniae]
MKKKINLYKLIMLFLGIVVCNGATINIDSSDVNKVIYKIRMPPRDNKFKSPQAEKFINDIANGLELVECQLLFNKTSSVFKIIDKLVADNDKTYGLGAIQASGIYFKDTKNKIKIMQQSIRGEKLNIILPYEEYKWDVLAETKVIDGYRCYKAVGYREEFNAKDNKIKIVRPEVWFTPEIPSSFGPKGMDGLPGLVLEGKLSEMAYFYATKIIFNVESDEKLERPIDGKDMTYDNFKEFMLKGYSKN